MPFEAFTRCQLRRLAIWAASLGVRVVFCPKPRCLIASFSLHGALPTTGHGFNGNEISTLSSFGTWKFNEGRLSSGSEENAR